MALIVNFTTVYDEPWTKLQPDHFKEDEVFTTFRGYTPKLDKFYNQHIGDIFVVRLDRDTIGKARLKQLQYFWSDQLPIHIIKQDTFQRFQKKHFQQLMENFYDKPNVYGFLLTFQIKEAEQR